jgi:hypothetical protein
MHAPVFVGAGFVDWMPIMLFDSRKKEEGENLSALPSTTSGRRLGFSQARHG